MSLTTWSFPTKIVFGNGALATLADHVKTAGGKRALVVVDPGVVKAGIADKVKKVLEDGGVAAAIFDRVDPNPIEQNIVDGVHAFRGHSADFVVSVGGGSPLDAGKLIALKITHERPLHEYDDAIGGDAHIGPNVPPIITVPTTAGTGSEVGRSGVVTLKATGRKTVIFSPYLMAKVALLDPELTVSMPPRVTAATGFDALTHCIEAFLAQGDHPMADGIALMGVELCAKNLYRAVEAPADLGARGAMMKAAMMGAVAFQKGLGVCHSLAHPLSSEKNLHHGLANALCLPAVCDFNNAAVPDRIERLRRTVDMTATSLSNALRSLREKIGLPNGLAAEGVKKDDIPKLADKAMEDACWRLNPRKVVREDMVKLYELSL